ncbi:MAG: hypothetical protein ACJ768_09440 [Gaiellaceae bacterium]
MASSTDKLYDLLEQLDALDDDVLAEQLPVPPMVARMAIAAASARVPSDPALLDEWALKGAMFCLGFRSDDAPQFIVAELPPVEGEEAVPAE